jgi:hypothetical protein
MQRPPAFGLVLTAVTALGAGCGDNMTPCGEGTTEVGGVCVATSPTTCGEGTKLKDGQCVIDPMACQVGTVLIAGRCVDPSKGLVVDLEESAEPNGLAIAVGVEASAAPAGTITLPPAGRAFIVHGHVTPFRDADGDGQLDPDIDTYVITAAGPTLVNVTVDGVGGTHAAFYVIGDPDGDVPAYERYGLGLTGDTSKRQLFLPVAGRYELAITDVRSLAIGHNPPGPAGARGAAGGPDAEYYASITAEAVPAPTPVAITGGVGTQAGTLAADEVKFFTAALGPGQNDVHEVMAGAAAASIVVVNAGAIPSYADEAPGSPGPATKAEVTVGGIKPGDVPLIAVDAAYNYGPAPEPFTLTITPG